MKRLGARKQEGRESFHEKHEFRKLEYVKQVLLSK
jgi:hypothetical protein